MNLAKVAKSAKRSPEKFKNLAYIWEPHLSFGKCQQNLCKMPSEMLLLSVAKTQAEVGDTNRIWHFKWLFFWKNQCIIFALSPVFRPSRVCLRIPFPCKVFTILSTFWVECIFTHTAPSPSPLSPPCPLCTSRPQEAWQ